MTELRSLFQYQKNDVASCIENMVICVAVFCLFDHTGELSNFSQIHLLHHQRIVKLCIYAFKEFLLVAYLTAKLFYFA